MARIRVFVVDDAAAVRRIVTDVLAADPGIEVVGSAANGLEAMARLERLGPDLVTLDIEMPGMDGLETLVELRRHHPRLPVIMFSSLTERGAIATMEALARGATDYVAKPNHSGGVAEAKERIRTELIPKIRALVGRPAQGAAHPAPAHGPAPAARSGPPGRVDAVAIGVSTGGPNALADILPALPADFPIPILIVQHMPPVFTRFLADRLSSRSRVVVREAEDDAVVEPGTVWVAPGDHHMTVWKDGERVRLRLDRGPQENSCRPSADPLFRSAAAIFGGRTLGLILTGMGHDGLLGAQAIRRAGGQLIAQDEASSVVWGMPGAIVAAGLADAVLPLPLIAAGLVQRAAAGRMTSPPGVPASPLPTA